jgi:hypothetical protein
LYVGDLTNRDLFKNEEKLRQTTYKVKVFFDHEGQLSAKDRLKRVIQEEALKQTG